MTTKTQATIHLETLVDIILSEVIEITDIEIKHEDELKSEVLKLLASEQLAKENLDYALMIYMENEINKFEMTYQGEKYPFVYANPMIITDQDYALYAKDILDNLIFELKNPEYYFTKAVN